MNANDGAPVEVDDVVAGVENEKRAEAGADVAVDVVVTAGAVGKEKVDGAPAVIVVAVLLDGVENEKREPDGAAAVVAVVVAGAPVNEKLDKAWKKYIVYCPKFKTNITGGAVVVVTAGAKCVVDGLLEVKRDVDGKPAEVGAAVVVIGVAPNDIGAGVLPPNGAVVDGPAPNVNEEPVAVGREVTVAAGAETNANVEGWVEEVVVAAPPPPKENVDGWVEGGVLAAPNVKEDGCVADEAVEPDPNVNEDGCVAGPVLVGPNENEEGWLVAAAGVAPNPNVDGWLLGAAAVAPKEKLGVVPVGAAVVVAPNPNAPVLPPPPPPPPNGVLVGALVVLPEPNVNGLAEAAAVGAVVVKLLPNANGVALVVAGFVDDPNENIFLKYSNLNLIKKKKRSERLSCFWNKSFYFICLR